MSDFLAGRTVTVSCIPQSVIGFVGVTDETEHLRHFQLVKPRYQGGALVRTEHLSRKTCTDLQRGHQSIAALGSPLRFQMPSPLVSLGEG